MSDRKAKPSAGSVALCHVGETKAQMAVRTHAYEGLIGNWRTGARKPGKEWRGILQNLYGIPRAAWDEPPPSILPPAPTPAASLVATLEAAPAAVPDPPLDPRPLDPARYAQDIAGRIESLMVKVDRDPTTTLSEKARILGECTRHLGALYKHTALTEAKIYATPAWARIRAVLVAVLPADELESVETALRNVVG